MMFVAAKSVCVGDEVAEKQPQRTTVRIMDDAHSRRHNCMAASL